MTRRDDLGGRPPILVAGLGSPDRGDDAVGPSVARSVAALGLPGVEVVEQEDPTDLIELWSDRDTVVVVDAVRSGAEPGSLHVLATGAARNPLAADAASWAGRGGTHAFGLATAIELARALGRLPRLVLVVGVEAAQFDHGAVLSPAVAAAVANAADTVVGLIGPLPDVAPERGTADVSR